MRAGELDEFPGCEQTGVEKLVHGLIGLPHGGAGFDRTWLIGNRRVVTQLRQAAVGTPPHGERVPRVGPRVRGQRKVVGGRLVAEVEHDLTAGGAAATATMRLSRRHAGR